MKRNFDSIIRNLTESINTHDYFVDFKKVFKSVDNIKYQLNQLNYLLGEEDFDQAFKYLFSKNPEIVRVFPILLAIREKDILVFDEVLIQYSFTILMDVTYYLEFIYKTGLIQLFKDKRIRSFVDYVTGVEVGLDTNARKNRSGKQMEKLVSTYLKKIPNIEYIEQANFTKIKEIFDVSINLSNSDISQNKRFDFVVKNENQKIFLIETNYYSTSGSKLNEVARSYSKLSKDIKELDNIEFIWITDGYGWNQTKKDLEDAYQTIKHLYTIYDLENNILKKVFNE